MNNSEAILNNLYYRASKGKPVYIHDVRRALYSLPSLENCIVYMQLESMDAEKATDFQLRLPRNVEFMEKTVVDFLKRYLYAEVYNLLSTCGAREMIFFLDTDNSFLLSMFQEIPSVFGQNLRRSERPGYGRCINVIDRMLSALYGDTVSFTFAIKDVVDYTPVEEKILSSVRHDRSAFLTEGLKGRAILGMDVGGTDIKAALVVDDCLVCLKEYDWFPAAFTGSRQLVEPIVLLTRVMRDVMLLDQHKEQFPPDIRGDMKRALRKDCDEMFIEKLCDRIEKKWNDALPTFDSIGLCFPDVVIRDRIVGGEVYKLRGIRNNPDIDFESDFLQLTRLHLELGTFCREPGRVGIINDGPMAAFTAAVEASEGDGDPLSGGVFAHTLGTELGTGWIRADGSIPDIPLEVYNCIVDLGSLPEMQYEPDDLRSIKNFNTGLTGTLQKYACQSGVFRLAMRYFPDERPDLYRELFDKGYVTERNCGYYVPVEPKDMRKEFLEHLMGLPEREGDEVNDRIWREIGESLAVTWLEIERMLHPATKKRILFGRLVKVYRCFQLMLEGARRIVPDIQLEIADSSLANSPLMKQLEEHPDYTVAQFAQAVGAVYYALSRLPKKE